MKDKNLISVDECMRDIQGLIEYFQRNAQYCAKGNGSPAAAQMRRYAESLIMARDALKTKYYGIP